jgi:hypothetical protein
MTRATLPSIAPKLAKIFPLLASDRDGEVLGAVVAIRRTLAAVGLDLHDLAGAIGATTDADRTVSADFVRPAPRWKELSHQERCAWLSAVLDRDDALSDFERQRVEEIHNKQRAGMWFSASWQRIRLVDEVLARAHAMGVRP